MKFKLKTVKAGCWCLILLLVICNTVFASALTYEKIDLKKTVTLTVKHQMADIPVSGVEFRLYRLAAITENRELHILPVYENMGVSLDMDHTAESWAEKAFTLAAYLTARSAENNPVPVTSFQITDANGTAVFSDLEVGLYLLVGKTQIVDQKICTPLPVLLSLPDWDNDNTWNYSPYLYTKTSNQTRDDTKTDLSAVKIWKDEGNEKRRPSEISVILYGNGEKYSTVKLNQANNWRYTWKDLNSNVNWSLVEEDVPESYSVTVVQEGKVFVVTNTYSGIPPENSDPPESDRPVQPELPRTGQLWQPVFLLSVCGLALILLGVKVRKIGCYKDEEK